MARYKCVINDSGRECTRCGVFKLWSEYYKSSKGKNGKQESCKDCERKRHGYKKKEEYRIDDIGRQCSMCMEYKPWSEFYKSKITSTGYGSRCKDCNRERAGCKKRQELIIDDFGRQCTKCNEYQPWSEFHKKKDSPTGHIAQCRNCQSIRENGIPLIRVRIDDNGRQCTRCKEYLSWDNFNAGNGARNRDSMCTKCKSDYCRFLSYGLPIGEYSKMYEQQKGKCAICGEYQDKLFVDHNHCTGNIRELLCTSCNTGIGHLKDSVTILKSAITYLEKHK